MMMMDDDDEDEDEDDDDDHHHHDGDDDDDHAADNGCALWWQLGGHPDMGDVRGSLGLCPPLVPLQPDLHLQRPTGLYAAPAYLSIISQTVLMLYTVTV
jgi:hypothetical protein